MKRLNALSEALELGSAAERAARLRDALALPFGEPGDLRHALYFDVLARGILVDDLRSAPDLLGALRERVSADRAAERLREACAGEPDPYEQQALCAVGTAAVRLELDLGRVELARARLLELQGEFELGTEPAELVLCANQYYETTGRYSRIRELTGDDLPDSYVAFSARHVLLARIGLEREAVRVGESDSVGRSELYEDVSALSADAVGGPRNLLRVVVRVCELALEADEIETAQELLQRALTEVDEHPETRADDHVLAALLALVEAEVAQAIGAEGDLVQLERAWADIQALWPDELVLEGGIGFFTDRSRRDLFCRMLDLARRVEGDEHAFRLLERARCSGSAERELGIEPMGLEAAQEWLTDRRVGTLQFVSGNGLTLALALDARGVRWFELEPVLPNEAAIEELRNALLRRAGTDGASIDLGALAEAVADVYLPSPLAAWLEPVEHVILVGRDWMHEFDFEALPLPGGTPVGLAKPVSHASSLSLARYLENRDGNESGRTLDRALALCATGLSYESPATGRLDALPAPTAIEEALRPTWADEWSMAQGSQASLSVLDRDSYDLLTVFAHGVSDPSRPTPVGILLAGERAGVGEPVWWNDLRTARVPSACALLTCRASAGRQRSGDGGYGRLPSALLQAGAAFVLASPRDLEAVDSLRLHAAWVERLDGGIGPGEALVRAKRALHEEHGGEAAYWATLLELHGAGWRADDPESTDPDR